MLRRLGCPESDGVRRVRVDFALLEHKTESGQALCSKATLDDDQFSVEMLGSLSLPGAGSRSAFHEFAQRFWSYMKDNEEMTPGARKESEDGVLLRWKPDLQAMRNEWSRHLISLFPAYERQVLHMVFFRQSTWSQHRNEILSIAAEAYQTLHTMLGGDPDFWVGEYKPEWPIMFANDARLDPCVIAMRFRSEGELHKWYTDSAHAKVRQSLYQIIEPTLLASIEASKCDEVSLHQMVENRMAQHIGRRDYVASTSLEYVTGITPFKPPVSF
jgi:hypothetical protein